MRRMIWYEWKRILKSRLTQMAVIGCGLLLIFCSGSNIWALSEVDENGNIVNGLEAAALSKEQRPQTVLDQETVDEYVETYLRYTDDPGTSSDDRELYYLSEEIYLTWFLPNRDILRTIDMIYSVPGQENATMKENFTHSRGKDFYGARKEKVQENLSLAEDKNWITPSEADWWNMKDDEVGEYTTGYAEGWRMLIYSISWGVIIMMAVCIGISPVFAGEYQTKCDSILLCMRYGKNRLVLAKIIASILHATILYWGLTIMYTGIHLGALGIDGWNLPIQSHYSDPSISYDLTVLQAYGLALLMGYVMTLGLTGFVLLVSSLLKNPYGVIITAFATLCVPLFLSMGRGGYLYKHLLGLLPEKIDTFGFDYYLVYRVGGLTLTWPVAAIIVNGICAVILSCFAYRSFRRHQVNK